MHTSNCSKVVRIRSVLRLRDESEECLTQHYNITALCMRTSKDADPDLRHSLRRTTTTMTSVSHPEKTGRDSSFLSSSYLSSVFSPNPLPPPPLSVSPLPDSPRPLVFLLPLLLLLLCQEEELQNYGAEILRCCQHKKV